MNASEKIVLRRKRHLVATHMELNETVMRDLRNCGLMWDLIEDQLGVYASNYARSTRYLDLFMKLATKSDAFHTLCDYLNNAESSYPWLGDELLTELRMETGSMAPDEYLVKEAKELVHVYFGGAKRLSEREKRTLEHVIAIRTQCAKEIWRNNFESAKMELDAERSINRDRESQFKTILARLANHVETHRKKIFRVSNQLNGHSSPHSGSDSPRKYARPSSSLSLDDERGDSRADGRAEVVEKLSQGIEELNTLTAMVTTEYEGLLEEKFKALSFMDVENGVPSTGTGSVRHKPTQVVGRLDEQVPTWMKKMTIQLNNAQFKAEEAEQRVRSLEEKLKGIRGEYEGDLRGKDHTIRVLAENLESAQRGNASMEEELSSLQRELQTAKSELKLFKTKTHYLSKSRHLGYIYDSFSAGEIEARERVRLGGGMKYRLRGFGGAKDVKASGTDNFLPRINHSSPESIGDSLVSTRRKASTDRQMVSTKSGPPGPVPATQRKESLGHGKDLHAQTKEAFAQNDVPVSYINVDIDEEGVDND